MIFIPFTHYVLEAQLLSSKYAFIPRISLTSSIELPLCFIRRQFPMQLVYAMTINKSQGQSINLVCRIGY
jgi:hypothetical protein